MIQLRTWKVVLVLLAAVFGVVFTLPNALPTSVTAHMPAALSQRLNLGLDLQGGSYLLLEVDSASLHAGQLTNLTEDVRHALGDARIGFTGLGAVGNVVRVRVNDAAQVGPAANLLRSKLAQPTAAGGHDLNLDTGPDQTITLSYPDATWRQLTASAVQQSIEVVRRRIDQLGTREPTIIAQGVNRIQIEAPGESDPEKLKKVIGQTAKLTFQMLDDTTSPADAVGHVPPEDELLPSETPGEAQGVLVRRRVIVSGADLTDARVSYDSQTARPVVSLRFNGHGGDLFGQMTAANIGHRFAVVLDGKIITDPNIEGAIPGGTGQISGNFTEESASNLALLLRSGALPAKLNFVEQRTVGAELGADAVRAGAISLGIGAIAIFIFIIGAYGLFGVFAAIALLVNVLMIFGAMSVTQATLTFPGIAGLILTLAVAVDANVLIYERMRDEAHAGRSPMMAADQGFRRALVSIIDANVTTLISALIMFQFGSGAVRGFAWTLFVGVLTSVFTAVLITQVLIGWWFRVARPKALPIA
ncbi:MAG: protein translocase subunit SecD [Caulobacteraceae bacterium]